jgi:hypothetical protein
MSLTVFQSQVSVSLLFIVYVVSLVSDLIPSITLYTVSIAILLLHVPLLQRLG